MNDMSGIQRAALDHAKRGDWLLADSLEVKHRIEEDGALCGVLMGGRLAAFAYDREYVESIYATCDACKGEGAVRIVDDDDEEGDEDECESCNGEGRHLDDDVAWLRDGHVDVEALNGEPIDDRTRRRITSDAVLDLEWARAHLDEYLESLKREPQQIALPLPGVV